jgi:hypothetical protein
LGPQLCVAAAPVRLKQKQNQTVKKPVRDNPTTGSNA